MPASENTPGIRILPRSDLATDILDFLVDRQARGLSPRTVAFYRKKLALFSAYMLAYGARDVFAVSPALLRAFLIDLAQTHTPGGCHAVYRSVRAFLRWWVSETEPNDWKNPLTRVAPRATRPYQPGRSAQDAGNLLRQGLLCLARPGDDAVPARQRL